MSSSILASALTGTALTSLRLGAQGYIIQTVEKKAVVTGTADDNMLVYVSVSPRSF